MKETYRIEYKLELTDDLEKEVIAFLNYREGGIIYIGVTDDGTAVGIADSDSDQLKIKDRLKNNIQPSCLGLFDVVGEKQEDNDIIKLIIASGSEKPYYLKKKGMSEKGCFMRIGTASEPMSVRQIEDLFAKRTRNSIGKITSNRQDLTFGQLKIYYEAMGLDLTSKFANNLELLTEVKKFNYVAYLMADSNGTSIKVAKYSSTDRVDLIETNEYGYCSLVKATKAVLEKLEIENRTASKITSKERLNSRLWNAVAIREAIVNAIIHNDYTREVPPNFEIFPDRFEITSYGGLFEGMTQYDFFEGLSQPRNKELMRIFKDLDMVEQLGSGVPRILRAYDKSCFIISDNYLRMIFPLAEPVFAVDESNQDSNQVGLVDELVEGLVESQKKIVWLITENPLVSIKEMAEAIGISTTAIDKNITSLKKKNLIKRVGSDKGGSWKITLLPENDN